MTAQLLHSITGNSSSASQQRNMPSTLNAYLLSMLMLTAYTPPRVLGAPAGDAPTEIPAGEPSGEEAERPSDLLSDSCVWDKIIAVINRCEGEFEQKFKIITNDVLDNYEIISLPAGCPKVNFSKESCLHWLVQGLSKYMVLLRYVEEECPSSSVLSEVKHYSSLLSSLIQKKMKHRIQVMVLSRSQEQQILKELEHPDTFHQKMKAYSVLRQLKEFLIDSKHAIANKERLRANNHVTTMLGE
ncbi:hypothetical protein LDENG_00165390 [Lucifuga dentata]|nr:hypothetical protein LDENG_00165390 [Lucifuga dentata]